VSVVASVSAEATRAQYEENLLFQQIQTEISRAQASENTLYTSLQSEVTTRSINDTSFNLALASETLSRQTGDNLNATNIVIEKNRAEAYEASLNIMINTESTRALGIEGGLRTSPNK